jgi:hypothetical protein
MVGWLIWCLRFHLNHRNKQKFKSVSYPADFLRKYLDSLILNLTKGKERYVELLDETLKKELQENLN